MRASGCRIEKPVEEAKRLLLAEVKEAVETDAERSNRALIRIDDRASDASGRVRRNLVRQWI